MIRTKTTFAQLLIALFLFSVTTTTDPSWKDPYSNQPRISVDNGHLILRSANNKNISMVSSGQGSIFVNNIDLSTLSNKAMLVMSRTMEDSSTIQTLTSRVRELESRIETFANVNDIMHQLEENVTSLISRLNSTSRIPAVKFRGLQRKVITLESQVRTLTNRLTKDDCSSNPCKNGGSCIDVYNGYICKCTSTWEGTDCDVDVNECALYAGTGLGCQNGATCINLQGSYRCECAANWYGIHCNQNHDDCSIASHVELCGHGTCINEKRAVAGQPKYRCLCEEGWTHGTGPACDQDVDECSGNKNTCSKNPPVVCVNLPGTFYCGHCPSGYTGDGQTCSDINECAVNNGGCHPLVTCVNVVGTRQCGPCPLGFVGDGVNCAYSNVCGNNNGGCHYLAQCISNSAITGAYRECRCPSGYVGSGEGLTGCVQGEAMTCATSPCIHGTCQMAANSYYCICYPGYTGSTCSQQINPCLSQPCQNGGTCTSQANNFTCSCAPNFEGPYCSVERPRCGGEFTQSNGTLKYPEISGELYGHNEDCSWLIRAEEGQVINITLDAIHLEHGGSQCVYDFLQINDGRWITSQRIKRFCGVDVGIGETIQSTHSLVYVWFRTDHSAAGYGFTISWRTVNASCGANLDQAEYGAITSPAYPGLYPPSRDCYWFVRVPPGRRIQFHFATIKIETHPNCSFDYLKLYDGLRENDPLLATYCTTTLPEPQLTSGSTALLHFHSDRYEEDSGFHISYAAVPGIPGCGNTLTAPLGSISSPNFPDVYDNHLDCQWLIRIHPGNRIQLTFQTFNIEKHSSCGFDFLEIYDGPDSNSPLLRRHCGHDIPPDLISNSHQLYLVFRTDSYIQHFGFKATYKTICGGTYTELQGSFTSPYFPENYPNSATCFFIISLPPGNVIQLEFPLFNLQLTSTCSSDYVQIHDGATEGSNLLQKLCGQYSPEPIISTYNEMLVKFISNEYFNQGGFWANYTNIPLGCGGVLRSNHGRVNTPSHPSVYPPSLTCNWIIEAPAGYVVQLTFSTFILERHSQCAFDFVMVNDSDGALMGQKYCGRQMPPVLTSTDSRMYVRFVSDVSITHDGFNASYTFLDASQICSAEYYLETGVLRSPKFPNRYPPYLTCIWVLHARDGHQISLNATTFHLESGSSCTFDYLEIRNGGTATSPLIGKYCGDTISSSIVSHSNLLWFKFVSDHSRSFPGFEIFYDTELTGCGGQLKSPTGSIISPNYPNPYGHNAECTWTIQVSEGSAIAIFLVDADIEGHSECRYDYLAIYDGRNENAKVLHKHCNNQQHPGEIRSIGNFVFIKFRTDVSEGGRGFHLNYRSVCTNLIKDRRRGVIESPNFPDTYYHNQNCTWTIYAPLGSNISLAFSHLFLENSSSCYADYIEVNQTILAYPSPEQKQLAKYCGTPFPLPVPIRTTSHIASVQFLTDASITHKGFRLEYKVEGCGGDITRSYSYISSPNYPNGYPITTQCIWRVKFKLGSQVQIEIRHLDLEAHSQCRFDHLRVYAGEDETSPRIAESCHSETSMTLTSHGNNMMIDFFADVSVAGKGFDALIRELPNGCGGLFTAKEADIMSQGYPGNYNFNADCFYVIKVDESHLVSLEFYEFSMPSSVNCTEGSVEIYDGEDIDQPLLRELCGEKPEDPVINATSNVMLVRLRADGTNQGRGFRAHYIAGCGRRINADESGAITTPNYPNFSFSSQGCHWILTASDPGSKVTLIFTYFHSPEGCVGVNSTFLEIRNGEDFDSPLIGRYCGNQAPPVITSEGNSLHLSTYTGGVFRATYGTMSSYCGETLASISGSISSPGFPDNYPMNTECVWTIVASAGNNVMVSFRSFNLAESDHCNMDYVEIHENDAAGRLIGRYCGNQLPSNVTAAHKVWIKFRSDEQSTGAGFLAQYNSVYGNVINGTEGIIESPGYPHRDRGPHDVEWLITVPEDKVISIQFLVLDIISREPCRGVVTIQDGGDTNAPELDRICGFTISEPVVSHSNQVLIKYHLPFVMVRGAKWQLRWAAVADSTIVVEHPQDPSCWQELFLNSSEPIEFTSPNYPEFYPTDINCTWIIRSPSYEHFLLNFTAIETFGYENYCYSDSINVYTVTNPLVDSWSVNTTLCGYRNATILSPANLMKVVFQTGSYSGGKGFHAVVIPKCGGQLTGSSGILRSSDILSHVAPIQARGYGEFICEWIINVGNRRTIQISFDEFQLPSDTICNNMYIMLLNGGYSSSPMLGNGKYCGTSVSSIPESSSNKVYVKLVINSFQSGSPNFVLRFSEVSVDCGGHLYLTDNSQSLEIKSPNHPNPPPHPMECTWVIMSTTGTRMRIDFDSQFHMTYPCYGDESEYVELHDGGTDNSPILSRVCGSTHPSSEMTTGNSLQVRYITQVEHPGAGFKATIQIAECGGVKSSYYGELTSPNYPQNYSSNQDCEWLIKAPYFLGLTFYLMDLDTPTFSNCSLTDYLIIREENKDGEIKGEFCGNGTGSTPIQIDSSVAYVRFKSDTTRTGSGFRMVFSANREPCGRHFTEPSGSGSTPNYPEAVNTGTFCHWTITAPVGRMVTLTFTAFNLPRDPNTNICIKTLYVQKSHHDWGSPYCGTDLPTNLESSAIFLQFQFSSLAAGEGFSFTYNTDKESYCGGMLPPPSGPIFMPNSTFRNESSYLCDWKLTQESDNSTVAMKFNVFDIPGSAADYCRDGSIYFLGTGSLLAYLCGNLTSRQLVLTTPYRETGIRLTSYSQQYFDGVQGTYNTSDCGGVIYESNAEITSPGYPSGYPPNLYCHWIIRVPYGDKIQLNTLDMKLEENCNDDYVIIRNGIRYNSPILGKFCGSNLPATILSDSWAISIIFHSNAYGSAPGFRMTTSDEQRGCGGHIQARSGIITSPKYPTRYENNVECEWTIERQSGNRINVSFVDRFDIQMSDHCNKDYILIEDFDNGAWIEKTPLCGSQSPSNFISSSTKLRIKFHSDDHLQGDGFKLKFSSACGGHLTDFTGIITSPNYPEMYDDNLDCKFIIGDPQHYVVLAFNDSLFDLEPESNCIYDYVSIYRGNSTSDVLLGTYCGQNAPPRLMVMGQVLIHFVSDYMITAHGFLATYHISECGGVRTEDAGLIRSPRDRDYMNDMRCTWYIQGRENKIIALKFIRFDVERSSGCYYDYVNAFDGNSTASDSLLGRFCGYQLPPIVKSTSNFMTVYWHTDGSVTHKGFDAFYYYTFGQNQGCGGTITAASGELSSLDFDKDGKYEPMLDCLWNLIGTDGQAIEITFSQLELESGPNGSCSKDYIIIRDGLFPQDPVITRICNETVPLHIKASSNQVSVLFHTDKRGNFEGFKANFSSVPTVCGSSLLSITNVSQTLTSPNYPSPFPINTFCQWRLSGINSYYVYAMVSLDDFDLPCVDGYLEISNRQMSSKPFRLCGPKHARKFMFWGTIFINFFSGANKDSSKGVSLSYMMTGCSANHTEESGMLINMYYPHASYSSDCEILIQTIPGNTISLYFRKFSIYSENSICNLGNMTVYDGENSGAPVTALLCGDTLPNPIFSTGHTLFVRVMASHSLYYATYTTTPNGRGCGGSLTYTNGTFSSPLYPSAYNKLSQCFWILTVPGYHTMTLIFDFFSLNSTSGCSTNYVEIYEGNTIAPEKRAVRLCGDDIPAAHVSTGNQLLVLLSTNITNNAPGFLARFEMNEIELSSSYSDHVVQQSDSGPSIYNGETVYMNEY